MKKRLGYQCTYSENLYQTIEHADACLVLTDWQQIRQLDLAKVKQIMNQPILVDGRNLFELETMEQLGFTYFSVGRPVVKQTSMATEEV